jgi:UDP-glucose:(heptosyl)LPS alpha-1,3-glucosyltransferase
LRVALVIERFEPRGGVEGVAWAVAHGLALAGDEVHVVARRGEATRGAALHLVRAPAGWQPLRVLSFSRAAARAARRGAFDVVHSFSRTRHQDVYRAGGGSHADYLERRHGRAAARLRRLSPRHAALLALERAVFGDASQRILCPSQLVADQLALRYRVAPERLAVVYNGVDLERFAPGRPLGARARLRGELDAGDAPVWLLLGSGFRRKGLDTALRALALARGDAQLWVAGRDDPRPWRDAAAGLRVATRVRFLGERADPEALYAGADALLLPTRYDAFANACLEAAAAGLPVVTSRANGAAEVLGAGARVVDDAEDAAALAGALDDLSDPRTREALGREARRAAEGFGWSRHIAALRALYAGVARTGPERA